MSISSNSDEYDLKKIQMIIFGILKEFDRICTLHGIKYSLEGGTLLGAIKYEDFVPWDDDIDIVMVREEYDKFLSVAPNEIDHNYIIQNFYVCPEFPLNYTKICYKNSLIYDYDYSHLSTMCHGIFIDIFPLDNVIDNKLKSQISTIGCLTGAKRAKLHIKKTCKGIKGLIYKIVSLLPLKTINYLIDTNCRKYNKYNSNKVYEVCNSNRKFKPLERFVYDDLIRIRFHEELFLASSHYDYFLKNRFGDDYLIELPPEHKRVPSHNQNIRFLNHE